MTEELPRRPMLKPGVARMWRGPDRLQLGREPGRSIVVTSVDDPAWELLSRLDGRETVPSLLAASGLPHGDALALIGRLCAAGMLADGSASTRPLSACTVARRSQLQPEYDAEVIHHRHPSGGAEDFARRIRSVVVVEGLGRVGATLALLTDAAGVGDVRVVDEALVESCDVSPGGHRLVDVGRRRQDALLERLSSRRRTRARARSVDLVVLGDGVTLAERRRRCNELSAQDIPHLLVEVDQEVGRIGPLVVPGRTACLHCVDHHRTDRDPDWPTLLAQLLDTVPRPAPAVLAATAAALAVTQICTFLAATTAAAVDGQLVARHAEVEVRRRTLPPHPRCGCSWRGTIAS